MKGTILTLSSLVVAIAVGLPETRAAVVIAGLDPLSDNGGADGWSGVSVLQTPIVDAGDGVTTGRVTTFNFHTDDARAAQLTAMEHHVTPLLVRFDGFDYRIVGVGTPRTPDAVGEFNFDFGLVEGTDEVDTSGPDTFHVAVLQQRDGVDDTNGGAIPFAGAGGSGMFQFNTPGPDHAPAVDDILTAGHSSAAGGRLYAFNVEVEFIDPEDSDNDGMPDAWEIANGFDEEDPSDAAEDADSDLSSNVDEFRRRTDPRDEDTDDDGYRDGVETASGEWDNVEDTGTDPLDDDSDGDGLIDGVENPELPYLDETQTGSDPNFADTDLDTLPDGVEISIGLSPASMDTDGNDTTDDMEDADGDGSPNGAELANGTGIADEDSDDDLLLDGVETNTGTWVSVSNTGTDPLDADSDGDSIGDGVENHDLPYDPGNPASQPGTDPNLRDTDGDLADDDIELAEGTDPTDANDTPAIPLLTVLGGLIGGDLTDVENDGVEGPTGPGPPQTAGSGFDWVSIVASEENYFHDNGGGEGAFDIFDNTVGPGGAKWCCGGPPQNVTVEFENPVSITHFTITSGNDVADRDPRDWQILGSNDGVEFTPIFTQTGDPQIWTARNQTIRIDLPSPSAAYSFIRYEVTRTNNANHQINEIEYFGSVGGTPLQITAVSYDVVTDTVSVTWTSKPGRDYALFFSSDLSDFGADINDSIPAAADAEQTTETFENPIPGAERLYFRVSENPG